MEEFESKKSVSSASHKKVSLLGVDLHMRHAQKQGRKVISTFINDRKSRKIPRCKTAVTFETRAQIMLVPHCACVSYNSSGYLDTCKRFALTRVPSTRISGYLAIRIRVNAASVWLRVPRPWPGMPRSENLAGATNCCWIHPTFYLKWMPRREWRDTNRMGFFDHRSLSKRLQTRLPLDSDSDTYI